jgi:hypothetical protein
MSFPSPKFFGRYEKIPSSRNLFQDNIVISGIRKINLTRCTDNLNLLKLEFINSLNNEIII